MIQFSRNNSLLVVVDIQEKLAHTMPDLEKTVRNTEKLIRAFQILGIPIIVTEQYPAGLGRTLPDLESLLINAEPIDKMTFSCWREERFVNALSIENRSHIVLCGMETHICVAQTALDLAVRGHKVGVVEDAVCAYNRRDHQTGISRMVSSGIMQLSTEMIVYELMERAGTDDFKAILPVMKIRGND